MKNLNKITKYFITLFWLGLSCSILKAEVVITELFILQADGTHTPQYVELYNDSDSPIDLENWSIIALDDVNDTIPYYPVFNSSGFAQINNTVIDSFGYFLISTVYCKDDACGGSEFYYEDLSEDPSDIIADYFYLPLDGKGSVILINDTNNTIDS
ncbi:uncharacterized protein METZ01_LOCUS75105, partial [marine metagenome]